MHGNFTCTAAWYRRVPTLTPKRRVVKLKPTRTASKRPFTNTFTVPMPTTITKRLNPTRHMTMNFNHTNSKSLSDTVSPAWQEGDCESYHTVRAHKTIPRLYLPGNVIRYFFCRALQLPPEVWLRFSTFNCSITYIMVQPNGLVSIRAMGDFGHMPYDSLTFSGLHGLNW
eukprot:scaffold34628_cov166-Amphora_coffeaeformis.AAC.2